MRVLYRDHSQPASGNLPTKVHCKLNSLGYPTKDDFAAPVYHVEQGEHILSEIENKVKL